MKMLSVLVPCYFCFTSKPKKVVVYFLCISCLGLEYLELSWCGVFLTRVSEHCIQLSSISAVFFQVYQS